ncbi:MAG TPA: hypothetical protein VF212_16935 [Longimicrobiales bacterium]
MRRAITRASRDPVLRAALALFVAAAAAFGWAAWRALSLEPLPGLPADVTQREPVRIAVRAAPSDSVLRAAVETDPFHPERRRPAVPFRFPGEEDAEATGAAGTSLAGPVRVVGTALLPDGKSFALCEWPGRPPRLVRVGETVEGLTLKRVEIGRAVFVTRTGERVVVDVPKAGT